MTDIITNSSLSHAVFTDNTNIITDSTIFESRITLKSDIKWSFIGKNCNIETSRLDNCIVLPNVNISNYKCRNSVIYSSYEDANTGIIYYLEAHLLTTQLWVTSRRTSIFVNSIKFQENVIFLELVKRFLINFKEVKNSKQITVLKHFVGSNKQPLKFHSPAAILWEH